MAEITIFIGLIAIDIEASTHEIKTKVIERRHSQTVAIALLIRISLASTGVDNNVSQVSDSFSERILLEAPIINAYMKTQCAIPDMMQTMIRNSSLSNLDDEFIPY